MCVCNLTHGYEACIARFNTSIKLYIIDNTECRIIVVSLGIINNHWLAIIYVNGETGPGDRLLIVAYRHFFVYFRMTNVC